MISVGSEVQVFPGPPFSLFKVIGLFDLDPPDGDVIGCCDGWGCSSAGRAPALQAGGQRFDPAQLHQFAFGVERDGDISFEENTSLH